ncbi:MAG: hypothetical protein NVS1B1_00210 [Candidatus Limnocylindrales bacterium]
MRWVGRLTHDESLAGAIASGDLDHPSIGAPERALLFYVEKLTLRPGEVERGDLDELRVQGFSDAAIGDIALNAALFAFMNRIVDGLGGALEGDMRAAAVRLGLPLHPGTFEHLEP